MKLTFLGTSHGHPEVRRYCTSVYVEHNGFGFVVDVGAPVEYLFKNRGIETEKVKAYFLTHMHSDHADTLGSVAKSYLVYHKTGDADVFFAEDAAIDPFCAWMTALHIPLDRHHDRFRLHITSEGVIYENYGLRVSAIRTEHIAPNVPTFAYLFEADDGKRVLFTGDLAYDFHDFPKIAFETEKPFDLIVSELTHLSADKAKTVLVNAKTRLMIFSHVTPTHNLVLLECENIRFPFVHIVACDGFEYYVV